MKTKKAIVLTDMHIPYHDEQTLRAVEQYMSENKFDYYINLGDLLDFDYISKYNENNKRGNELKRIDKDYATANEILDRHQAIIRKNNKKAEFILLEGNHDARMEKFIDKEPIVEGRMEMDKGLHLEKRGFKFLRESEVYTLQNANFIHGKYTSKFHAHKTVDNYGVNIFYGHLHTFQTYMKVLYGNDKTIVGQSIGCLCEYDQKYLKGNPTAWQQGFAVFEFFPDGFFNYYPVSIFKHRFVINGKVYG